MVYPSVPAARFKPVDSVQHHSVFQRDSVQRDGWHKSKPLCGDRQLCIALAKPYVLAGSEKHDGIIRYQRAAFVGSVLPVRADLAGHSAQRSLFPLRFPDALPGSFLRYAADLAGDFRLWWADQSNLAGVWDGSGAVAGKRSPAGSHYPHVCVEEPGVLRCDFPGRAANRSPIPV